MNKLLYVTFLTPFLLFFTACDNDIFVDRDDLTVEISETLIPFTGGTTEISFNPEYADEVRVSVDVFYDSMYISLGSPVELNDMAEINDDMIKLSATCDRQRGKVTIDLDYCMFTDTTYIYVMRNGRDLYFTDVIKILPASSGTVSKVDMWTNAWNDGNIYSYRYQYRYVNDCDAPREFTVYERNVMACRGLYTGYPNEIMNLILCLGANSAELPGYIVEDGKMKATGTKIPFKSTPVAIPGEYFTVDEPVKVTIPANSIGTVISWVRTYRFTAPCYITVSNNALPGSGMTAMMEYMVEMPYDYSIKVETTPVINSQ